MNPLLASTARAFLLLALLGSASATPPGDLYHPEAGRPALRTYRPADYGGNPQVWTMLQRTDGTRLFGLYGGLSEFDGARWQTLNLPLGSVRGLAQTPDGRAYYTASSDLGWIDRDPNGTLQLRSILAELPDEMRPAGPFAELVVHRGRLHVSTTKGVARWDGQKFDRVWVLPGTTTTRLTGNENRLWFRRMGSPELYELTGDTWVKIVDDPALQGKPVHFVVAGADGQPVLGIETIGLRRIGPDGSLVPWTTPADSILAQAQLYAAATLRDGSIAIGTFSDGLLLISPDGHKARQVTMRDGLPSNLVQGLGTDRDGRLWLCTYHGVATMEWPPVFTLFDQRDGLDASMVRSMRRHEDRIVLGGVGGTSFIEPAADGSMAPAAIRRLSALQVANSNPVPHSTGLVSGGTHGLTQMRGGQPELVLKLDDNILFLQVSVDNPDRLIFAGQKGIGSALYQDGHWRLEGYAPNSQISTQVVQTRDGTIWSRTVAGEGWRFEVPRLASGAPDWPAARAVSFSALPGWPKEKSVEWSIVDTPAGLTAFTQNAILLFDPRTQRFTPDQRFDRRLTPTGTLFTLHDGPEGIWCAIFPEGRRPGGRNAMGRFVLQSDGSAQWIPLREDLAQTLGALAAHEVVPDSANPSIFWLRGLDAVMRLDFPRLEVPPPPAAPLLRRIRCDQTFLPLPATDSPLRLPWAHSALTFQYAAPGAPLDQARFEHRLIGWNDNWTDATAQAEATFVGLAAGAYTLEVRERDSQGRTGPALRIGFTVLPPWWETPWAWTTCALLIAAALAGLYRWRVTALNRRGEELEALVAERTAELASARDQAEAASRAKSTFLAHMSHELRTPLNGIIGYAQVLLKDTTVAGQQRDRVRIVHASGQHLLRMINEVLDFAKIEAGKLERHDAPFHFEQLLRELTVSHEAAALGRGLGFALEWPGDLPSHVTGDAQKLRQVLDNLLSNAVKFTKQGRVALLVAPAGGDRWRFAVTDTGVGLSAEDRARLFQPFEQARSGRPAEPGTGLGLAITQRLVHLLGGDLQVESELGRGSTFHFTLELRPVVVAGGASHPPFALAGYAGPRRRIAVVDDAPVNRSLLTDLLTPLGFEVVEFASAEEVLAVAPGGLRFDLAFLDIKMPGIDGLELARRLRARDDTRTLPLVFTSASVLTFDHAAAQALGCPDFLPKPFAEPQLHELLDRLLQLEWQHATVAGTGDAYGATATPLPAATRERLLALADSGDIAALREAVADALRENSGHATLRQVETAAASYQLERVRQLLRAAAAP